MKADVYRHYTLVLLAVIPLARWALLVSVLGNDTPALLS